MVSENEFSHVVKLSEISGQARSIHLVADAETCTALAHRFDLVALESLGAELALSHEGEAVVAKGKFTAELTQRCIASGEPVPARLDEPIEIRFVAEPSAQAGSEIELAPDEVDSMFHNGQTIDLGEAVAQSLGLALDPYPRSEQADAALKAAGVKSESEVGPFSALSALRDKLAGS